MTKLKGINYGVRELGKENFLYLEQITIIQTDLGNFADANYLLISVADPDSYILYEEYTFQGELRFMIDGRVILEVVDTETFDDLFESKEGLIENSFGQTRPKTITQKRGRSLDANIVKGDKR